MFFTSLQDTALNTCPPDNIRRNAADFLGQCTSTPAAVSAADNNNDKNKSSIDYKIKVIIVKK